MEDEFYEAAKQTWIEHFKARVGREPFDDELAKAKQNKFRLSVQNVEDTEDLTKLTENFVPPTDFTGLEPIENPVPEFSEALPTFEPIASDLTDDTIPLSNLTEAPADLTEVSDEELPKKSGPDKKMLFIIGTIVAVLLVGILVTVVITMNNSSTAAKKTETHSSQKLADFTKLSKDSTQNLDTQIAILVQAINDNSSNKVLQSALLKSKFAMTDSIDNGDVYMNTYDTPIGHVLIEGKNVTITPQNGNPTNTTTDKLISQYYNSSSSKALTNSMMQNVTVPADLQTEPSTEAVDAAAQASAAAASASEQSSEQAAMSKAQASYSNSVSKSQSLEASKQASYQASYSAYLSKSQSISASTAIEVAKQQKQQTNTSTTTQTSSSSAADNGGHSLNSSSSSSQNP